MHVYITKFTIFSIGIHYPSTYKTSKWVWSGNTTITNCRQTCGIVRKSHTTIKATLVLSLSKQGWSQRGCLRWSPKAKGLYQAAQATSIGEGYERGLNPTCIGGGSGGSTLEIFLKINVSKNAFQAILKPIFPYSVTSILSKVRHSNTLFLSISFACPCRPFGALVKFPCGGGGGGAQQ